VGFLALKAAHAWRAPVPINHPLVLHRVEPEQGIRRFYSLMIERDLFGTGRLVRNWGSIGTKGDRSRPRSMKTRSRQGKRWRRSHGPSGGGAIKISDRQRLAPLGE
jgi:hypothetical protein